MNRRSVLRSMAAAGAGLLFGPIRSRATLAQDAPDASDRPSSSDAAQVAEPFRIDFGPDAIADLHRRIDATRWPEMPFDSGWSAGTNDGVLRDLVSYWRSEYDWSAVQERLNRLDHRRVEVDGEAIHFVRYAAGPGRAPFPLLLLHGWPGSFHEFGHAAPLVAAGAGAAGGFDVIVPSLPGFVFSDPPKEPGVNPGVMAERLHRLMTALGHERYGVQGGDWGGIIAPQMALRHPDSVVGLHVNFVASAPPPPDGVEPSAEERAWRERRARFQDEETGYSAIQGTRPQTLAYAQQDSPVGWLAWMLEKYWDWSDHGDDLWDTFDRDDVLTTAMLYWLPGRILSAARIYYEMSHLTPGDYRRGRVEVPTGYARFPAEPWSPPREVVERSYNLVHYREMERGGHFPALEQPELWSREVAAFFSSLV